MTSNIFQRRYVAPYTKREQYMDNNLQLVVNFDIFKTVQKQRML